MRSAVIFHVAFRRPSRGTIFQLLLSIAMIPWIQSMVGYGAQWLRSLPTHITSPVSATIRFAFIPAYVAYADMPNADALCARVWQKFTWTTSAAITWTHLTWRSSASCDGMPSCASPQHFPQRILACRSRGNQPHSLMSTFVRRCQVYGRRRTGAAAHGGVRSLRGSLRSRDRARSNERKPEGE